MASEKQVPSRSRQHTLKVAQASGVFVSSFSDACAHQFRSAISHAVHPNTVRATCSAVNLDSVLNISAATSIFRSTYALHKWIAAPEAGLRALIRHCLQLYEPSLRETCNAAAKVISSAASAASERGGLNVDEFLKELLLEKALEVVELWKQDTLKQLAGNLHAEAEFPAPERFMKLRCRLEELLQEGARRKLLQKIETLKRQLEDATAELEGRHSPQTSRSQSRAAHQSLAKGLPISRTMSSSRNNGSEPHRWAEYFMGWIDKRSRRGTWQRRWVVISPVQQRLWYFGDPEEQPARGSASLKGAEVQDGAAQDGMIEDRRTRAANPSHVFHIMFSENHCPSQSFEYAVGSRVLRFGRELPYVSMSERMTKPLATLTLCAASETSKDQWMQMMRRAIAGEDPTTSMQGGSSLAAGIADEDGEGNSSPVERKISTKVFRSSEDENGSGEAKSNHSSSYNEKEVNEEIEDETESIGKVDLACSKEDDEEAKLRARLAAEAALFDEIAEQASSVTLSDEEVQVLECCVQAAREYLKDSLVFVTEQAGRVISDGMLPVGNREEEMRTALLQLLMPAVDESEDTSDGR